MSVIQQIDLPWCVLCISRVELDNFLDLVISNIINNERLFDNDPFDTFATARGSQ